MKNLREVTLYRIPKDRVQLCGFEAEVRWQSTRDLSQFSESDLLRQTAWVILCSGFREATIRRCFSYISLCFLDWESSSTICESAQLCRATALSRFNNEPKIDAILKAAAHVNSAGFASYKKQILSDPIGALRCLPFIGKSTAHHLATNLVPDISQPARHLTRPPDSLSFSCQQ